MQFEGGLGSLDLRDWSAFRQTLLSHSSQAGAERSSHTLQLWEALPEGTREFIKSTEKPGVNDRIGITRDLNRILTSTNLFSNGAGIMTEVGPEPTSLTLKERIIFNREILDSLNLGIKPYDSSPPLAMRMEKLLYSALYSTMTILLVFGVIGMFQDLFPGHSPLWRYFADASYWIYLTHLPLVAFVEICIFQIPLTAAGKIIINVILSTFLLVLSYHYKVRSTFIGKILNGRTYPFTANPLKAMLGR